MPVEISTFALFLKQKLYVFLESTKRFQNALNYRTTENPPHRSADIYQQVPVGALVGACDGALLGDGVGLTVGADVGIVVGEDVGADDATTALDTELETLE